CKLNAHADNATAHDELLDVRFLDHDDTDETIRREAVLHLEGIEARAFGKRCLALLLRPAYSGRIVLISLVDKLRRSFEPRVLGGRYLQQIELHVERGKELLTGHLLAL